MAGPRHQDQDSSVTSPGASKQQQTDGQHRDFCAQSLRGLFQQRPESCVPVGSEETHTGTSARVRGSEGVREGSCEGVTVGAVRV